MPVPNPNHHLWRNGRLWWTAFTVIYDGWRQERIRRSLGTAELDEARRRRDHLFRQYAMVATADVVALRATTPVGRATAPYAEPEPGRSDAPIGGPFALRAAARVHSATGIDPEASHA